MRSILIVDGSDWTIFTKERFKLKMKNLYSVYDVKAKFFKNLIMFNTDEEAKRCFADIVNDARTDVSRHPEDYVLYNVGCFDQTCGSIMGEPISLISGLEVINKADKPELKIVYNDKDPALVKDEDIV